MSQTENAKNDMLNKCIEYCKESQKQLRKTEEFRQAYNANDAIRWYTDESFLYQRVNRALRSEDIDELYTYRFYIIDLCTQLSKEYQQNLNKHQMLKLYRGQLMSNEELEKLRNNIGNLISTNGFFSTTRDINVARLYITSNKKSVLFEIDADPQLKHVVLADIQKFSLIPDEPEVLFSIGAVFEIKNVYFDEQFHLC
ncbi:unnamed protein product [Didymodactylos carnosus]|uniref:NAD(P)(+)--arginine ADP-ribosyltransferase n=1 Tax=Didymodactylos carnosus TaxID=1234261 RepID=A0A8S2FWS9_9BILA|nr:unnamed protein product [Didymodactylos carnosus]CAF4374146.1 unnamed protein product [Didymodactylos carnosus]